MPQPVARFGWMWNVKVFGFPEVRDPQSTAPVVVSDAAFIAPDAVTVAAFIAPRVVKPVAYAAPFTYNLYVFP